MRGVTPDGMMGVMEEEGSEKDRLEICRQASKDSRVLALLEGIMILKYRKRSGT